MTSPFTIFSPPAGSGQFAECGRALERDGFLVIDRLLDESRRAALVAAVDEMWNEHLRKGGSAVFLHELGFAGRHQQFLHLLTEPTVLRLMRDTLGPNIHLYHSHLNVDPPLPANHRFEFDWHRDGGAMNDDIEVSAPPRLALKAGYFLTDIETAGHGALHVVPGSHHSKAPPADLTHGCVPLTVQAGSVVLFDRRLVHARGENRSTATRRVLFYSFAHRWVVLRDRVTLPEGTGLMLSPLERQLLGLGGDLRDFHVPSSLPLASWSAPAERGMST
jgi:ectoine hydroxylase